MVRLRMITYPKRNYTLVVYDNYAVGVES